MITNMITKKQNVLWNSSLWVLVKWILMQKIKEQSKKMDMNASSKKEEEKVVVKNTKLPI